MSFEKTKRHILTLKIITCIIINFLRLKDLYSKISSNKLIDNLSLIKDLSKLTYNLLTFNLISVFYNSVPLFMRFRKIFGKNKKAEV
jgi:hypothetical protein